MAHFSSWAKRLVTSEFKRIVILLIMSCITSHIDCKKKTISEKEQGDMKDSGKRQSQNKME